MSVTPLNPVPDATENAVAPEFSNAWLTPGRFAALLALLIAAFFPDVLFAGKSFVFRDFGIFTYPNAAFQRDSFWRGEIPLWNPWNNCGIPFLGQWNTATLYPLSLIYLLLPLTWGLNFFLLLHLFIAGLGMYVLASAWTRNRLAAGVAGVAFAFNGLTLNCLMWTSNLAALAWMPWVIWSVEQAWRRGDRRMVVAGLAGAMQMLTGAPEIILFTWGIVLALWFYKMVVVTAGEKSRGRVTVIGLGVITLAGLLSAAQWLPFLDLLAHSDRSSAYGTSVWAIPQWGWANLFVPLFHCYRAPQGVYFQPGQDWTSSYYLGAGVLTLAALAVWLVRTPRVWLLAGLAIFGFLLAMGDGGFIYPALKKIIPVLGFMRFPIKFAFLTVFAVPMLAALALARLEKIPPVLRGKWLGLPVGMGVLSILIISGILVHARNHPFSDEEWAVLFNNGLLRMVFLIATIAIVLFFLRAQDTRRRVLTGILLLICIWLDVVTHAPRQNPSVAASAFNPGVLSQQFKPALELGEARLFMTRASHDLFYGAELTDLYQDYLGRRSAPLGDCNLLDGVAEPDGFYSLYLGEQRELFEYFFVSPTNAFPSGLADFLGVAYVSDPEKILGWQYRASHQLLYSIGVKPEFVELSNTPALLLDRHFDPRAVVYLPPEDRLRVTVTNAVSATVKRTHWSAQRVELETEAGGPALLVLAQSYYHPWRAYVDGQSTGILRANDTFQAIQVPAGQHTVKFVYVDRLFQAGAIVSLVTLVFIAWLWRRWNGVRKFQE